MQVKGICILKRNEFKLVSMLPMYVIHSKPPTVRMQWNGFSFLTILFHLLEHIEFKHWLNQNSRELLCFKKENQTYLAQRTTLKKLTCFFNNIGNYYTIIEIVFLICISNNIPRCTKNMQKQYYWEVEKTILLDITKGQQYRIL